MLYNQNLQLENILKIWNQVYLENPSLNKNIQTIYLLNYSLLGWFFADLIRFFPTIIKRKTKFNQVYKYEARFKANLDLDPFETTKKKSKIDLKEISNIRELIKKNITILQNYENPFSIDEILDKELKKITILITPFFHYFKFFLKFILIGFTSPIKILRIIYITFRYFYTRLLMDILVIKKQKYINYYYKYIHIFIPTNYEFVIELFIYPLIKVMLKIVSPIILIIQIIYYRLKLIFVNISLTPYIYHLNAVMYKVTFLFLISFYIILFSIYFDLFDLMFATIKNNRLIQVILFIIPIICIITKKTHTIILTILKRLISYITIFNIIKLVDCDLFKSGQPIKKEKLIQLFEVLEKLKLGTNKWIYENFMGISEFSGREHFGIHRFNSVNKPYTFKTPLFVIKDFSTILSYLTWSLGKFIKTFLWGLKGNPFGWKRKRILNSRGYFIQRRPKAPNYLVIKKKFNTLSSFCDYKTSFVNHTDNYTLKIRSYFKPWQHILSKEIFPMKRYRRMAEPYFRLKGSANRYKSSAFCKYMKHKYHYTQLTNINCDFFDNYTYSHSILIILTCLSFLRVNLSDVSPLFADEEDRALIIKNEQELLEEHENYFDWSQNNFVNFSFFFNRARHELRYPLGGSELEIDENSIENHFFCVDSINKIEDDITISTKVKVPFKNYFWNTNINSIPPSDYNDQRIDLSYNEKLMDALSDEPDIDEITEYSDSSFIMNKRCINKRTKNAYKLFNIRQNIILSNTRSYTILNKSLLRYTSKVYQVQYNIATILNEYLVDTTNLDTPLMLEPRISDTTILDNLEILLNDQNKFIRQIIRKIEIKKSYNREQTKILNEKLKDYINLLISLYNLGKPIKELNEDETNDKHIPFVGYRLNSADRVELLQYLTLIELFYDESHPLDPKEKGAVFRYLEILEKFKEKPYYSLAQQTTAIMGINLIKSEDATVTNYGEDLANGKKYKKDYN